MMSCLAGSLKNSIWSTKKSSQPIEKTLDEYFVRKVHDYNFGIVRKLLIVAKMKVLRMSWNPQQFLNDLE